MTTHQAKRLRAGTAVAFDPNPVSALLYSGPLPEVGEVGEVVSIPFPGGRKTFLPGPAGGLLYVKWSKLGTMGVSAIDVERA